METLRILSAHGGFVQVAMNHLLDDVFSLRWTNTKTLILCGVGLRIGQLFIEMKQSNSLILMSSVLVIPRFILYLEIIQHAARLVNLHRLYFLCCCHRRDD